MSDLQPRPRVLVVGGGIAGLVAARRLLLGAREVTVLEASDRWGGQVSRHTVGGIDLDAAAESFATRGGTVAALATQLGLGDDIVTPLDSPAWLYRADGSAVPLPATSVLGIPAVPMAADVIAAVGTGAAFRAQLDSLMPGQRGSRATTLGQLVRARMGDGVLEGLVAPVVRGVHSTHPDELDLDRAVPGLREALLREGSLAHAVGSLRQRAAAGSQVAGIRGGVSRLVDALVADLERWRADLRLGARVVAARPGAVTLADGSELAGEVLIAAPDVETPDAYGERVPGRTVTLATLVVEAPALDPAPRGTGVLVAADAPGVTARALTHSTAKWPWLFERTAGRHVLRLSYDEAADATVDQARRDAETLTGIRIDRVVDAATTTWARGVPGEHSVDGMSFAGEAGSTTGIAAVIGEARERAERLLEEPGMTAD